MLTNAFHSTNLFSCTSRYQAPTNSVAPYFCILAYLKDGNVAAHSVDSDIFQSSGSSICALQDLTLTFISLSIVKSWGIWMTHRWRVVTGERDKKTHYNLNYDSHQPLFYQIAKIERCVEYESIATCEYALIYTFRS